MQQPNLFTRDDTFFGVCQAIGEDFGFNPNWLRVALALALFFSPAMVLAAYAALAVTVFVSRWLAPKPAATEEPAAALEAVEPEPAAMALAA